MDRMRCFIVVDGKFLVISKFQVSNLDKEYTCMIRSSVFSLINQQVADSLDHLIDGLPAAWVLIDGKQLLDLLAGHCGQQDVSEPINLMSSRPGQTRLVNFLMTSMSFMSCHYRFISAILTLLTSEKLICLLLRILYVVICDSENKLMCTSVRVKCFVDFPIVILLILHVCFVQFFSKNQLYSLSQYYLNIGTD